MVEWTLPKPQTRVRFPYPAPNFVQKLTKVVDFLIRKDYNIEKICGKEDNHGKYRPYMGCDVC